MSYIIRIAMLAIVAGATMIAPIQISKFSIQSSVSQVQPHVQRGIASPGQCKPQFIQQVVDVGRIISNILTSMPSNFGKLALAGYRGTGDWAKLIADTGRWDKVLRGTINKFVSSKLPENGELSDQQVVNAAAELAAESNKLQEDPEWDELIESEGTPFSMTDPTSFKDGFMKALNTMRLGLLDNQVQDALFKQLIGTGIMVVALSMVSMLGIMTLSTPMLIAAAAIKIAIGFVTIITGAAGKVMTDQAVAITEVQARNNFPEQAETAESVVSTAPEMTSAAIIFAVTWIMQSIAGDPVTGFLNALVAGGAVPASSLLINPGLRVLVMLKGMANKEQFRGELQSYATNEMNLKSHELDKVMSENFSLSQNKGLWAKVYSSYVVQKLKRQNRYILSIGLSTIAPILFFVMFMPAVGGFAGVASIGSLAMISTGMGLGILAHVNFRGQRIKSTAYQSFLYGEELTSDQAAVATERLKVSLAILEQSPGFESDPKHIFTMALLDWVNSQNQANQRNLNSDFRGQAIAAADNLIDAIQSVEADTDLQFITEQLAFVDEGAEAASPDSSFSFQIFAASTHEMPLSFQREPLTTRLNQMRFPMGMLVSSVVIIGIFSALLTVGTFGLATVPIGGQIVDLSVIVGGIIGFYSSLPENEQMGLKTEAGKDLGAHEIVDGSADVNEQGLYNLPVLGLPAGTQAYRFRQRLLQLQAADIEPGLRVVIEE